MQFHVNSASLCGIFSDEVSDHLDVLQADLDTLKDMLSGNQYSLDASTILGVRTNIYFCAFHYLGAN